MKLKMSNYPNTLALFIPSVQYEVPCKIIADKFAARKLGDVSRIEWVENSAYSKYKKCFVFLTLAKSKNVKTMLSALKTPKGYRLYYSSTQFWKVVVNTSSIAVAPPNVHMDIQVSVPSNTNIDFVYEKLDAECIGKIAGYYLVPTYFNHPNITIIGIVFEYWYRNHHAIALQQALLNNEFVEFIVLAEPHSIEYTELDETNNVINKIKEVWKIHESIYAPILSGVSPYIWTKYK